MKPQVTLPTLISSLRIVAVPLFLYLYDLGDVDAYLGLLTFCAATDYIDGYFARKLDAVTCFGTYFDSAADFCLMFSIFTFFSVIGVYPFWLPLLIAIAFLQFLATSRIFKKLYDPVGKYLGSALYIGVVLTLLVPLQVIFDFVQYAFVVFFLISLYSRAISIQRQRKTHN